jgi:hypothetical protein
MIDTAEIQFDAIRAYLAQVPRDRALPLSAQILRDAGSNEYARRVVASRAFDTPVIARQAEAAGPIVSVALSGARLEKERGAAAKSLWNRQKRASRGWCAVAAR